MSSLPPRRFRKLPLRPDPDTGKPFPPHGRAFQGVDREPTHDRGRETRLSKKPSPPPGRGPVIAWYRDSKWGKLQNVLWLAGFFVCGLTVLSILRGDGGFDWVPHWQIWALIAAFVWLPIAPLTAWTYSAGADWFNVKLTRLGRTVSDTTIKLYELKNVKIEFPSNSWFLTLQDDTTGLFLTIQEFQYDRRYWDLIYNGILHSVADGAKITKLAREYLELDQIPELKDPDGKLDDDYDDYLDRLEEYEEYLEEIRYQGGRDST